MTVVDGRSDWLTEERFPNARLRAGAPEDFARAWKGDGSEYVVIATHDHALDQRLVQALLPRPLRFFGMIGSTPKQRKFALRLRARGFGDDAIGRLHTPLGLAIGAETPEEIAVSVVAQLIAVRRGRAPEPGWVPPPRTPVGEPSPAPPEPAPSPDSRVTRP